MQRECICADNENDRGNAHEEYVEAFLGGLRVAPFADLEPDNGIEQGKDASENPAYINERSASHDFRAPVEDGRQRNRTDDGKKERCGYCTKNVREGHTLPPPRKGWTQWGTSALYTSTSSRQEVRAKNPR